jgi:phosphoserine phosphatase RsbU/P
MSLGKLIFTELYKPTNHVLLHKSPFVIGRSADCDLVLDRFGISKHHLQIIFDAEEFVIQDLKSKNGTLLNGTAIERARLEDRDVISAGGVDLQFRNVPERELSTDLQKKLKKIQSALRFTKSINKSAVLDPILDEIMTALMQLSQAERGFVLMEDSKGTLQMVRSVNFNSTELRTNKFRLSMSAIEQAIAKKETVAISNAQDDTYFRQQTSVQELELKTLVCVPILTAQNRVIGILYADSDRKEQEFADLDIQLLESLASNAAIGIENADLNREIVELIGEVSTVLKQIEESTTFDHSLHSSVEKSLQSLAILKRKRFSKHSATTEEIR